VLKRVQNIDINVIKHAAEYLNSSKVKYDDDVIDNEKLIMSNGIADFRHLQNTYEIPNVSAIPEIAYLIFLIF
jgi:hypothetical protein